MDYLAKFGLLIRIKSRHFARGDHWRACRFKLPGTAIRVSNKVQCRPHTGASHTQARLALTVAERKVHCTPFIMMLRPLLTPP